MQFRLSKMLCVFTGEWCLRREEILLLRHVVRKMHESPGHLPPQSTETGTLSGKLWKGERPPCGKSALVWGLGRIAASLRSTAIISNYFVIANLEERGSVAQRAVARFAHKLVTRLSFLEHVLHLILSSQRSKTENSWCSILKYAPLLNEKKKKEKKIISRDLCFYIRLNKSSSCLWILQN